MKVKTRTAKEQAEKLINQLEVMEKMYAGHEAIVRALSASVIEERVEEGIPFCEEQAQLVSKLARMNLLDWEA